MLRNFSDRSILFFTTLVFVFFPATLYFFNRQFWEFDSWLLLPFLISGVVAFVCLSLIHIFLLKTNKKILANFHKVLLTLTLIILINDVFSPLQLGPLDGKNIVSSESISVTVLETILSILFVYLVWFINSEKRNYVVYFEYFVYISSIILIALIFLNFGVVKDEDSKQAFIKNDNEKLPNIYLIHMDGLQADFLMRYLNQNPKIKSSLKGFTFFKNNLGSYPQTAESIPSYLTGEFHEKYRFNEWLRNIEKGTLTSTKEKGYRLTNIGSYGEFIRRPDLFDNILTESEIFQKYTNIKHSLIVNFTRLWLAKLSPNFLVNESLVYGKEIGKKIFQVVNYDVENKTIPINVEDGSSPVKGYFMMKYLTDSIQDYPKNGQFIISVNNLLHDTMKLSKDCSIQTNLSKQTGKRYYDQLVCAMKVTEEFIMKLKELDYYDNSIIIILGDHGGHQTGQLSNVNDNSSFETTRDTKAATTYAPWHTWTKAELENHARPALLIKGLKNSNNFTISDLPVQLVDVYPTLMGQLGMPTNKGIDGLDIFNIDRNRFENRHQIFYAFSVPNREATKVDKCHALTPSYDSKGILSLNFLRDCRTTQDVFFKDQYIKNAKRYKEIKLYYYEENKKIKFDLDDVYLLNINDIDHWGAWTSSDKVTISFVPDQNLQGYSSVSFEITGAYVCEKNKSIKANFSLNDNNIGLIDINMDNVKKITFPKIYKFKFPQEILMANKFNKFEIKIEGAEFSTCPNFGVDKRKKGLGIRKLMLM